MEDWKIKIAVLWVFLAVSLSASIMREGGIALMLAMVIMQGYGMMTEYVFFSHAIFWLIPLTMAFLSLTLKNSANRWANIIVGIVLAAISIFDLGDALNRGRLTVSLVSFSIIVASALIVWYAWKSKQKT